MPGSGSSDRRPACGAALLPAAAIESARRGAHSARAATRRWQTSRRKRGPAYSSSGLLYRTGWAKLRCESVHGSVQYRAVKKATPCSGVASALLSNGLFGRDADHMLMPANRSTSPFLAVMMPDLTGLATAESPTPGTALITWMGAVDAGHQPRVILEFASKPGRAAARYPARLESPSCQEYLLFACCLPPAESGRRSRDCDRVALLGLIVSKIMVNRPVRCVLGVLGRVHYMPN